ncbi:hypothetical protein EFK83_04265 [Lactococcus cremoris]|nr:hypothetical protein [Lactococcus cremoris]MCT0452255.1 hypothetical protein [Lactococcus cremoris]MCT0506696.1 hypothetical protein [Lactococcus cremoris]MCT4407115.1 hypothetical protein [Lactococcus cremoris]MCT4436128.1 hypothetical protein [Lactococcus cremoris]
MIRTINFDILTYIKPLWFVVAFCSFSVQKVESKKFFLEEKFIHIFVPKKGAKFSPFFFILNIEGKYLVYLLSQGPFIGT